MWNMFQVCCFVFSSYPIMFLCGMCVHLHIHLDTHTQLHFYFKSFFSNLEIHNKMLTLCYFWLDDFWILFFLFAYLFSNYFIMNTWNCDNNNIKYVSSISFKQNSTSLVNSVLSWGGKWPQLRDRSCLSTPLYGWSEEMTRHVCEHFHSSGCPASQLSEPTLQQERRKNTKVRKEGKMEGRADTCSPSHC